MIYNSILETIGNTPVVRLNRVAPKHVEMYVKIEAFNPASSVKDRLALAIIDDAERRGTIKPGPDGRRGDVGQYRHRARDGLRRQGLSVRRDHGRDLLGRAAQDHAGVRRQGDPHAGGGARHRHGAPRRGAREAPRLVPRAAVPEPREPGLSPPDDGAGDPAGLRRRGASTSGSPAGARAARSPAPAR